MDGSINWRDAADSLRAEADRLRLAGNYETVYGRVLNMAAHAQFLAELTMHPGTYGVLYPTDQELKGLGDARINDWIEDLRKQDKLDVVKTAGTLDNGVKNDAGGPGVNLLDERENKVYANLADWATQVANKRADIHGDLDTDWLRQ